MRLLRTAFLASIIGVALLAETAPAPIDIRPDIDRPNGSLVMTSRSSEPIAAYVIRFDNKDEGGRLVSRHVRASITAAVSGKGRAAYQPGEVWSERGSSGQPVLDLVVFEDGTTWGDNKAGKLAFIEGFRAGAASAR